MGLQRRERVEPDGRPAHADAIAEPGRESVVDEHAQRLANARNTGESVGQLVGIEHARMGGEQSAEDCALS